MNPGRQSISAGQARMPDRHALALILLVFVILATVYNVSMPLFEAPDEMDHFRYVLWLVQNHRVPDMILDHIQVGHEVGQPPLYYALLAPFVAPIDTADFEHIAPPNPYWSDGGGTSVHYHSSVEAFPYQGTALAVHLARFISTLIAAAAVAGTYAIARQIAPQFASLAAALVAFNPQFIAVSAAVTNDTLVTALCSLLLALLIKMMDRPRNPWWLYLSLGALWGLAALSKLSGAAIGAIVCIALLMIARRQRSWSSLVIGGLFTAAGAMIVAGWWFGRNWSLYGDPLAWAPLLAANKELLRPEPLDWPNTFRYATFLQHSYWGIFGHGVRAPRLFYHFADGVVALAVVGLALRVAGLRKSRPGRTAMYSTILLVIWLVLVFGLLLRWMRLLQFTDQGRLLFPAASSVAVLLALGLAQLSRARPLRLVPVTAVACWAAALPFVVIRPAYALPRSLAPTATIPNPVQVDFGDGINLLGYSLSQPAVRAGESVLVDLYWQATAPLTQSHVIALHVLGPPGEVVGALDTIPYRGRYPTPAWLPGAPFRDTYSIQVRPDAPPGRGILLIRIYPWSEPDHPLSATVDGNPIGDTLTLAQFKVTSGRPLGPKPAIETGVVFDPVARLIGFDLPAEIKTGEPFALDLYWEALAPDGQDYTVFVHLLDSSGSLVAQADAPPQDNWYPTSLWAPGDRMRDSHSFAGLTLEPGTYHLAVGLYVPPAGDRLPAYNADGVRLENDRVNLSTIQVVASQ
jgi:4-amino-4-deoxy-L-arabinose transferase-like glycosyltransferase